MPRSVFLDRFKVVGVKKEEDEGKGGEEGKEEGEKF